jgi:hypothetical protein
MRSLNAQQAGFKEHISTTVSDGRHKRWRAWPTLNNGWELAGGFKQTEKRNGEKSKMKNQTEDQTRPEITREQIKSAPSFLSLASA